MIWPWPSVRGWCNWGLCSFVGFFLGWGGPLVTRIRIGMGLIWVIG